jgi:hypothetical protein
VCGRPVACHLLASLGQPGALRRQDRTLLLEAALRDASLAARTGQRPSLLPSLRSCCAVLCCAASGRLRHVRCEVRGLASWREAAAARDMLSLWRRRPGQALLPRHFNFQLDRCCQGGGAGAGPYEGPLVWPVLWRPACSAPYLVPCPRVAAAAWPPQRPAWRHACTPAPPGCSCTAWCRAWRRAASWHALLQPLPCAPQRSRRCSARRRAVAVAVGAGQRGRQAGPGQRAAPLQRRWRAAAAPWVHRQEARVQPSRLRPSARFAAARRQPLPPRPLCSRQLAGRRRGARRQQACMRRAPSGPPPCRLGCGGPTPPSRWTAASARRVSAAGRPRSATRLCCCGQAGVPGPSWAARGACGEVGGALSLSFKLEQRSRSLACWLNTY